METGPVSRTTGSQPGGGGGGHCNSASRLHPSQDRRIRSCQDRRTYVGSVKKTLSDTGPVGSARRLHPYIAMSPADRRRSPPASRPSPSDGQ